MSLQGINHLAFITDDMVTTIRFYRDLLGMKLSAGIGHDGYRHYFFQLADGVYPRRIFRIRRCDCHESKISRRSHHPAAGLSITYRSRWSRGKHYLRSRIVSRQLGSRLRARLTTAMFWSIYFYDPHNNIPLEATWQFMDLEQTPAISEDDPLDIAARRDPGSSRVIGLQSRALLPESEMRAHDRERPTDARTFPQTRPGQVFGGLCPPDSRNRWSAEDDS